jgi:hypothetical protein
MNRALGDEFQSERMLIFMYETSDLGDCIRILVNQLPGERLSQLLTKIHCMCQYLLSYYDLHQQCEQVAKVPAGIYVWALC